MVDENKVRLMTRLAIFEKHESGRNLVMSKYYKSDYVRYNVLKTLVAATVVYWSIVGAYIFMKFDDLLTKINELDYFKLMYNLLGGYVACAVVYFLFASVLYKYRYYKAKPGLIDYNVNLKALIELENGGPVKHGKIVGNSELHTDGAAVDNRTANNSAQASSQRKRQPVVNRSELVKQRMLQEEKSREQQIKDNVRQRNERVTAQNDAKLRQQRQMEQERRRIQERRRQLEKEQLERFRYEQMQNTNQFRENHVYQGNSHTEDMGRRDR